MRVGDHKKAGSKAPLDTCDAGPADMLELLGTGWIAVVPGFDLVGEVFHIEGDVVGQLVADECVHAGGRIVDHVVDDAADIPDIGIRKVESGSRREPILLPVELDVVDLLA